MMVTCMFRFEERPESDIVELLADDHAATVCQHCLTILAVHRRIHKMKIEKVVVKMIEQ